MQLRILILFLTFFLTNPIRANDIETMIANHPQIQRLERNRSIRQKMSWFPLPLLNLFFPVDDDALLLIHTDIHESSLTQFD